MLFLDRVFGRGPGGLWGRPPPLPPPPAPPPLDPGPTPARPTAVPADPESGIERHSERVADLVMVTYRLPRPTLPAYVGGQQSSQYAYLRTLGADVPLQRLVMARDGMWVGWPEHATTPDGTKQAGVDLSGRERDLHLGGYCNTTLWPLYHSMIERPEFRREWRDAHRDVNQRFADMVAPVAAPGALVWVHDYHLQLVPGLLRAKRPDLRIGFFLHIPF